MIAEVSVVVILLLLIIFKGGDSGQLPQAFTPNYSPEGYGGIGEAAPFTDFQMISFMSGC